MGPRSRRKARVVLAGATNPQEPTHAGRDEPTSQRSHGVPARALAARLPAASRSGSSSAGPASRRSSSRSPGGKREGADEFVFYDGPPFANGLPHYGHLLTGFVKDAVPRYRTMRGQVVFRRFGWDCHGLPAEVEAERELGIAGHPEITAFGIANFNEVCRTSVLRYTDEWQRYVERQARWVDFEHDYKTLDLDYMESVMWAFRSLWDQGLIYEGFRVLAYCWRCETPLSNTETRMDDVYRDRQDPALTVEFELLPTDGDPRPLRLLAWTTTPWTLPANLALAVGPDVDYVVVEQAGAAVRAGRRPPRGLPRRAGRRRGRWRTVRGAELVGRRYLPAVRLLRRPRRPRDRAGLPGARRRLRLHRRGHRHRPPGARLRRGRPDRLQRRRHPDDRADGRARSVHGRRRAVGRRARLRRQPRRDPRPQGPRRGAAPRDLRPPVPALLALRPAARLPGHLVVVRRGDQVPRPDGRAQRGDHLGARAPQARQLRQVAGERPRLVDQPQPLLGLADPGVAQRRPGLPAHRRLRLAGRAGGRLRRRR